MSYLTSLFRLSNYWWELIWLFAAGAFLLFVKHERTEIEPVSGQQVRRWEPWAAVLLVLPLVLWAGFRGLGFGDTAAYRASFLAMPSSVSGWAEYLETNTKDRGFSVLSMLIKLFIGDSPTVYFLIIAVLQMLFLAYTLRKYACNYWLAIFFFVASTDYLSWMHNGMRQFLAVTVIFAATTFILKRQFVPAVLMILLASVFHMSALLMLPVIFIIQGRAFNKTTLLCIAIAVLILFFADQFTDLLDTLMTDTQYSSVVTDWTTSADDGMNPIRVLVYAVPTILALVGYRQIRAADNPVINLCVNAGVIAVALGIVAVGTSGIFMGRLPIYVSLYSNCILLPWELENLFTKQSVRIMKVLAVGFYIVFFYYQMHFTWGAL